MKNPKIIFVLAFLCLLGSNANSQIPERKVFFGIYGGMSFFFPSGVNNYISDYLDANQISVQTGTSDIIANMSFRLNLSYRIKENMALSGLIDFALAPKFIYLTNTNGSESFSFNRVSPGALCEFYFGQDKTRQFFVGAGPLLNFMFFEDFSAASPGLRLEAGRMIRVGALNLRFLGVLNIMSQAKNKGVELNYTDFGVNLGIEF